VSENVLHVNVTGVHAFELKTSSSISSLRLEVMWTVELLYPNNNQQWMIEVLTAKYQQDKIKHLGL
jgi:hypothetical protein